MAQNGGKRQGAGRPKGSVNKSTSEMRKLAGKYSEKVFKELARLATEAESEQARVSACKELLDRAYGKSPQAITDPDGGKLFPDRIEVAIVKVKG